MQGAGGCDRNDRPTTASALQSGGLCGEDSDTQRGAATALPRRQGRQVQAPAHLPMRCCCTVAVASAPSCSWRRCVLVPLASLPRTSMRDRRELLRYIARAQDGERRQKQQQRGELC